jgi:ferritin
MNGKDKYAMLSANLQTVINDQINKELYSAYLYLGMSAWCESANLPGAARWLKAQAQEEQGHALKFYNYVYDRGGKVTLEAIGKPEQEYASLLDLFQQVLEHERKVTALISGLYKVALAENDYAAQVMLHWFINEQVEEEKNASMIIESLKMVGTQGASLFMVDRQLGARGAG